MRESVRKRFITMQQRYQQLQSLLEQAGRNNDTSAYRELGKELSSLEPGLMLFCAYVDCEHGIEEAKLALKDPDLEDLAQEEIRQLQQKLETIEADIKDWLLPSDPDDDKNVFLEIRAGTGGAESALFAGDLLRMYLRFAERKCWQTQVVAESESELGGYKEVIVKISGKQVYANLKFESGGHRVQRVPETEAQGRVHTSAVTVAVLPEIPESEAIKINPEDIRIDTFRASGAGGQHVNKTDSAIRITHLPTGLVVECQDERSQHRNRATALAILSARLTDRERQERLSKEAQTRKSLVGSGDRSDRIRTYNFPQGRFTDHRINLTLYRLPSIMDGEIDDIVLQLKNQYEADRYTGVEDI